MRHVVFVDFYPNEQRWEGVVGRCQTLFLLFFPCSADNERDWPLFKVCVVGLATNTLNVRNNKNNHHEIYIIRIHSEM